MHSTGVNNNITCQQEHAWNMQISAQVAEWLWRHQMSDNNRCIFSGWNYDIDYRWIADVTAIRQYNVFYHGCRPTTSTFFFFPIIDDVD